MLFESVAMKLVKFVQLFFIISSIIIFFPLPVIPQGNVKAELQETKEDDFRPKIDSDQFLEEDPLSEIDSDLGFVEDPQILIESDEDSSKVNDEKFSLDSDTDLDSDEVLLDVDVSEQFPEEDIPIESDSDSEAESFDENKSERIRAEGNLEESEIDLVLESDPFEAEESEKISEESLEEIETDFGLESDPFDEKETEFDLSEDPLSENSENINIRGNDNKFQSNSNHGDLEDILEEEEFPPIVSFSHEVKTMLGGSETKGLSILDPLLSEIKEIRLVTTYDQSVKVQTSPQMYNFFRLSVSFSQNYEINKKRIFDGFATVREIYSNYRVGSHQVRYGTQIFDLGKVDLDKVIDVLHMNNIMGIYTFDPDDTKDAIPSIRYNWFRGDQTATVFLSPIRQQTVGMRFNEFREEVEKKEQGTEDAKVSFLRDYYGIQYQWTGDIMDTRLGIFHWFDSNPYIKLEYKKVGDNGTTLQGSFENMFSKYNEKETRSDFLTFEIDATWTDMVWKFESGYFKNRNLYSYEIPDGKEVRLSTLSAPHFAFATSFERTFPYFYWLMLFSHRKWYDVSENTHVFMYENEVDLVPKKRDLFRNQISGVAVLKTPDNSLRITLLNYQTWPFKQNGFASLFTWERFKENMELELKYFRLETENQKMLEDKIKTNQIFLTYTQKFKAN